MFNVFNQHCPEYNVLSNQHVSLVELFVFFYLNTEKCRGILARKHCLEEEILQNAGDKKLFQTHKKWLRFIDNWRNEMIKNIYNYSDYNKYEKALFLVGAEHRKAIINKIPKFEENNKRKLNWDFNYSNNFPKQYNKLRELTLTKLQFAFSRRSVLSWSYRNGLLPSSWRGSLARHSCCLPVFNLIRSTKLHVST